MKFYPMKGLKDLCMPGYKMFEVEYRLTEKCNFNCWYCTDLHNNKVKFRTLSNKDLNKLAEFMNAIESPKIMYLYGGEPTIHPQFIEVVKVLDDCVKEGDWLEIQTNLSLPLSKIKELDDCDGTKWLASYHYGQVKDDKKFLEKVNYIHSLGRLNNVYVMYQKDHRERLLGLYKVLKKMVPTELKPLLCGSIKENEDPYDEFEAYWNDEFVKEATKNEEGLKKSIRARFEDGSETWTSFLGLWADRQNSFKGMMCDVSRSWMSIEQDGSCYQCFGEIFEEDMKPHYNVFEDDNPKEYIKSLKPMKCPFDMCFCEFAFKKWRE